MRWSFLASLSAASSVCVSSLSQSAESVSVTPKDPDMGLDCSSIIEARGYPVEVHTATTTDGYLLTMFRIPRPGAPVVFLQHGLLDSCFTFVNNFEEQSVSFLLYDHGYDVWIGNNRGNKWGKAHSDLDTSSDEFWDFSWDEMAMFDLPTMLKTTLDTTGMDHISAYMGHSEGTIQAFSGFGLPSNQDIASRVNLFVALAPVAYVSNQRSLMLRLLADVDTPFILHTLGVQQFLPDTGVVSALAPGFCRAAPGVCDDVVTMICGPSTNLNETRMPLYTSEFPAGTSVKNMMHWANGVKHDKFQMFDYGTDKLNQEHYGSDSPPLYNLTAMPVPVALFYGGNDYLADVKDVQRLLAELNPAKVVYVDQQVDYAHMDFVWAYQANDRIYSKILDLIDQYK